MYECWFPVEPTGEANSQRALRSCGKIYQSEVGGLIPGHAGLHISVSLGGIVNPDVFIITLSPSGWVGDTRLEWKSFKVLVEI